MTTITHAEATAIMNWLVYIMIPLIGLFFFVLTYKSPGKKKNELKLSQQQLNDITDIIGIITSKN